MTGVQKHSEPVDIVYLWVDGADPVWRNQRKQAYAAWVRQHPGALAAFGNAAGRYRDNGELLFNLRALEKFFPNHGTFTSSPTGKRRAGYAPPAA